MYFFSFIIILFNSKLNAKSKWTLRNHLDFYWPLLTRTYIATSSTHTDYIRNRDTWSQIQWYITWWNVDVPADPRQWWYHQAQFLAPDPPLHEKQSSGHLSFLRLRGQVINVYLFFFYNFQQAQVNLDKLPLTLTFVDVDLQNLLLAQNLSTPTCFAAVLVADSLTLALTALAHCGHLLDHTW